MRLARAGSAIVGGTAAILSLAIAAACGNLTRETQPPPLSGDLAFVNVSVITMEPGDSVRHGQTILVRNGRIAAIGPTPDVRLAAGTPRVDGVGRYLIPGLIDAHVHLEHFEDPRLLALFLASGVTTVRNMDGRPHILEWKRRIAAGELAGPSIHSAGPVLDGDPPILPDNARVTTAAAARDSVAAHSDAGYEYIKVYSNLPAEAYAAVLAEARARGMFVVGHVPRQAGLEAVLAADGAHRSIEHLADFSSHIESDGSPVRGRFHWSKLYLAMEADSARMAVLADRLASAGVWVVPTMIQADRAIALPDSVRRWLGAPEMRHLPAEASEFWEMQARRGASRLDADDWPVVARGRWNRLQLVRALHRHGVRIAAGTDTPNPFVVPGVALHLELENLVAAGLTPYEALAAATRDAARLIAPGDSAGIIRAGARADLVLLAGDPLADIANARRPVGVMRAGRWRTAEEIATLLPDRD